MSVNNPQLNMDGFMQDPLAQMNFQSSMAQNIGQAVANSINQPQYKPLTIQQPQERKDSQLEYLDFEIDKKINSLQKEFSELAQKKQELEQSITGIETKLAANRARRIKKNDDVLSQWRWKQEQNQKKEIADMQYNWQKEESQIASEMTLGDYDSKVDHALQQYRIAQESYAANKISGNSLKEAENSYTHALQQRNKFADKLNSKYGAGTYEHRNGGSLGLDDNQRLNGQKILELEGKINAFNNGYVKDEDKKKLIAEIDSTGLEAYQKEQLKGKIGKSVSEIQAGKNVEASTSDHAGALTDKQKADRMTIDELFAIETRNKYQDAALERKYTKKMQEADAENYKAMDKTGKSLWYKKNKNKFNFLKKKGLI